MKVKAKKQEKRRKRARFGNALRPLCGICSHRFSVYALPLSGVCCVLFMFFQTKKEAKSTAELRFFSKITVLSSALHKCPHGGKTAGISMLE